ncbi:MAG: hypothetical protein ACREN4_03735 [Candidatus Dormibacteria bacterium]
MSERTVLDWAGVKVVWLGEEFGYQIVRKWASNQILVPPAQMRFIAQAVLADIARREHLCEQCERPMNAQRSTKRFCGDACKHRFARRAAREAAS